VRVKVNTLSPTHPEREILPKVKQGNILFFAIRNH
jgi:hypothetical protein